MATQGMAGRRMKFTLTIQCDNAAFECKGKEVARILHNLAAVLSYDFHKKNLYDINGNKVGVAEFEEDENDPLGTDT